GFSASAETRFRFPRLKAAAASSEVTAAVCFSFFVPAQGSTQRPMAVARIRLPLATCYRYPGLRKANACEWLLQRAPALPWPLALRLQQLRREALQPSTYPFELRYTTGLVLALRTQVAAYARRWRSVRVAPARRPQPRFRQAASF